MGRMYSVKMEYDDGQLSEKIRRYPEKVNKALKLSVDLNAAYATAWMKSHAPWHDDTGAARAGLMAIPHHSGSSHELMLAHSVHYGIWLEVAHNRKYAIILPTMRHVGPKILKDAKKILKQIT